ncbi:MAG: hypothetical protein HKO65_17250 [Gemmatimonadetes bacterium]|nr:hypothetical protein [Gemmatimonadota bacterium]NNM06846.1 hypothetical protein [Gemmatimonadota bacterium]
MNQKMIALTMVLAFSGPLAYPPSALSAQGGPPPQEGRSSSFLVGLTAGAGAVDNKRREDAWDFGPVFGGRFGWSRGGSAVLLTVDAQPFRAGRTNQAGDFRAVYILPTYAVGSPGRRLAIGLGMGVFDLTSEFGEDNRKVGFVPSLSGSTRVSRSISVEVGWKRIRNVEGIKANLFTLQLVQLWRF